MTPDLSYTTGREGESSARTINGMEKKTDITTRTAFRTSYTNKKITAVQWGYSDSRLPRDKPKQAFIALICCGQYMAVSMPGHGDLTTLTPRMASSLTLWAPTRCIDSS